MPITTVDYQTGIPFHGEVNSSNASAGVAFTLYQAGTTTELTVGAQDWVVISHASLGNSNTTLQNVLFDGDNMAVGAGELICGLNQATTAGGTNTFGGVPHICQKGTTPRLLASGSGNVFCVIRGVLVRG